MVTGVCKGEGKSKRSPIFHVGDLFSPYGVLFYVWAFFPLCGPFFQVGDRFSPYRGFSEACPSLQRFLKHDVASDEAMDIVTEIVQHFSLLQIFLLIFDILVKIFFVSILFIILIVQYLTMLSIWAIIFLQVIVTV